MQNYIESLLEFKLGSKERVHNTDKDKLEMPKGIQPINTKPLGLWYGFGNSWIKWVESNMPEWKFKNYFALKVNIKNILVIGNKKALEDFNKEFQLDKFAINWLEVTKKYSGIEFPTDNIFNSDWTSTWDIASGCIWDSKAIKNIKKINKD